MSIPRIDVYHVTGPLGGLLARQEESRLGDVLGQNVRRKSDECFFRLDHGAVQQPVFFKRVGIDPVPIRAARSRVSTTSAGSWTFEFQTGAQIALALSNSAAWFDARAVSAI